MPIRFGLLKKTPQNILQGCEYPRLKSEYSNAEICLLGGRKNNIAETLTNFTFSGDCGFSNGQLGIGQGPLSSSAGAITFPNSDVLKGGTLSGVAVFEFPTLANYEAVFCTSYNYSAGWDAGLIIHIDSSGTIRIEHHDTGVNMVQSNTGDVVAGVSNVISWSYNRTTGFAQICINGKYYSATSIRDTSTTMSIGAMGGYYDAYPSVGAGKKIFHLNAVWGYDISPSMVKELGNDPFSIFNFDRSVLIGQTSGPTTHSTSGDLTGQSAVIAGTAARASSAVTHDTSGAITGSSSSIAGVSARTHIFSSTGALTGQSSSITGSAVRSSPGSHVTDGALSGPGASIVGSASRIGNHPVLGDLIGSGSAISGSAARVAAVVSHATSGDLIGGTSVISGTASNSGTLSLTEADINAIVDAIWARAALENMPANVLKMNSATVIGNGSSSNKWRGV